MHRIFSTAIAAIALTACTGTTADETPVAVPVVEPTPVPEVTPAGNDAAPAALVPSPSETQKALQAAGIDVALASLITHPALNMTPDSEDQAAVTTGVIVADLILTATTSTTEQLVSQLETIQLGMKHLDGGSDIDSVLEDLKTRVKEEAITREEVVSELELLSSVVIPELEFNGRGRIVPLIQAGSWLEASNLLSRALIDADQPADADAMIKQPEVVEYFLKYVSDNGVDTPAAITGTLAASLEVLNGVSNKEESLTRTDLESVRDATQAVLSAL